MSTHERPNARRYLMTMRAAIEADLGVPLSSGTIAVPADDRAGTGIATLYPFDDCSAIWCDPEVVPDLTTIVGERALSPREFADRAVAAGAEVRGFGLNRVLDGPLIDPDVDLGTVAIRVLDPTSSNDIALMAALRAEISDDDAEEADFDVGSLDPDIVAAVTGAESGSPDRVLAFASTRLADSIPFDDIGVATHPAARRRGLGVACVHALVRLRQPSGTPAMYRCAESNVGSGRIAERLGFELAQVVGSVRFGD